MRAITLRHPWPWAICCAGKPLENRTWRPQLAIGEKFAIHGGRWPIGADNRAHGTADAYYVEEIIDTYGDIHGHGLYVGGVVTLRTLSRYTGIVAVATYGGVVTESDSPWFCGPFGWKILGEHDDVPLIVLPEPVPCRGAQGLWDVPDDVLTKMRAQFGGGA